MKNRFILVICLGIALRYLMLISAKSLWGDEFFSIGLAQKPFLDTLIGSMKDVHPPIFFILLNIIVRILGNAEWVLRFISFLSGIGLLIVIYYLARTIFGEKTAVLSAFFVSISPYWLQSANEIRSYSFLLLLQ